MTLLDRRNIQALLDLVLPSRRNWLPWCILILALAGVLLAWHQALQVQSLAARQQFDIIVDDLAETIRRRMVDHERILLGGAGLFDASGEVSRLAWKSYIDRLQLTDHYPGIQAVGYSELLRPGQLAAFEAAVRREGFPDFSVRPPGARTLQSSIKYIEPFGGRNLAAFGFDMLSESVRREAMLAAARTGKTRLSGKVRLAQETHAQVQPGTLMYVPVYAPGQALRTGEERMRALRGFVYSPYRMHDLIEGIFRVHELPVDFRMYDGSAQDPQRLLFDSGGQPPAAGSMVRHKSLALYGQTWTLVVRPKATFLAPFQRGDTLMLVLGIAISLLLFLLVASLARRREQAQALAVAMTAELGERKQALRRSEERLALALKGSNDGWWDLDLQDRSFFLSRRGWQMLGRTDPGMLNRRLGWRALFPAPESRQLHQVLRTALSGGGDYFSIDSQLVQESGKHLPVLLRGYIQRGGAGRAVRITGTIMDLSERKRVEQMKNDFVSTVSHELRTPLTSIAGALGLMRGGALGAVPAGIERMLEIAHQNSLRLSHLINDLLDMDKLAAGQMSFDLAEHDLDDIVRESIAANQAYACQLQVRLGGGVCPAARVRVDAMRLQQVLANLLSNAIKFSVPGGQVGVRCETAGQRVRVSVVDHGPGVPAQFRPHIFQKFTQADGGATRRKDGTGLGLAISKELMERMGGCIGFDSEEGQGATFWFELPLLAASGAGRPEDNFSHEGIRNDA